jgi:hypothetical protein
MTNQEIKDICNYYGIFGYTINPDGSIDVNGDVKLTDAGLGRIPIKFNKVDGYFECSYNKLTDLENFPNEISGSVYLTGNNLKNLKGFGKVGGITYLHSNPLESLEGYNGNYGRLFVNSRNKLIRKTKLKILDIL